MVNNSLHDAGARMNTSSHVFMTQKFLHHCICAHARTHMHFLRRVCMHLDWCFRHHACAGVYIRQVL